MNAETPSWSTSRAVMVIEMAQVMEQTIYSLAPQSFHMLQRLKTARRHINLPKWSIVQNIRIPCCPRRGDQKTQRNSTL